MCKREARQTSVKHKVTIQYHLYQHLKKWKKRPKTHRHKHKISPANFPCRAF